MSKETYHFRFDVNIPSEEIKGSLLFAVLAAESLHGRSAVQLDASFHLDPEKHFCTVDATTEIGHDIARIFTGFLAQEFGEATFKVTRVTEMHVPAQEQKDTEIDQGRI
ncbi:MAG: hypothetical protein ABSB79_00875 [Syntrophales bacterium]